MRRRQFRRRARNARRPGQPAPGCVWARPGRSAGSNARAPQTESAKCTELGGPVRAGSEKRARVLAPGDRPMRGGILRYRLDALSEYPRMPRGNSKESQRWAYRVSSILFPVAKCMDADADRCGELDLRKPHKPAQSRHVRT